MNQLIQELFHLSDELDDNRFLYWREYQQNSRIFNDLTDQVEKICGRDLSEALQDAVMDYISLEEYRAFHLGLRLGMRLHTL